MGDKGRKRFTVDRKTWLRGKGRSSVLLDDKGCRCCLGFAAQQLCGIADSVLFGKTTPASLPRLFANTIPQLVRVHDGIIPEHNGEFSDSAQGNMIMHFNDTCGLFDEEREELLTKRFAELGIDVEFIGSGHP